MCNNYFLYRPNTNHNKQRKYLQHAQTLTTQYANKLHECNVFDMLLRDGGYSQMSH